MTYTNLSDLLKGICDAIRNKKGTTGPIKHQDIPSEIASIKTQSQDVLSLASGITSYTESFSVNGEERPNVLVQPSDFSDESKVSWDTSTTVTKFYTHSIENVGGSENGVAAVITSTSSSSAGYSNVAWFNTTVDVTAVDRTYLIAIRAKASRDCSVLTIDKRPTYMCFYHPTGNTSIRYSTSFSFAPTTEWKIFYAIVNIAGNYYMYNNTIAFYNHGDGTTYYIDWMAAYDVTGTTFANMTFGARATAYSPDVLSGKSFYKDGVLYTGSMTDNGTVTPTLGRTTTSYTIPAGKHSGSGTVSLSIDSTYNYATPKKDTTTYHPGGSSLTDQVFTSFKVTGDSNLIASNIKSGVSIFNVTGEYKGEVGYIGRYLEATRSNRTSIRFSYFYDYDIDDIIGFNIIAEDSVESSSSYDYISSLFIYGESFVMQTISEENSSVEFYSGIKGDTVSWNLITSGSSSAYPLEISINDDYLGFRGTSVVYRCYPIYKRGGTETI